jgi:hypothetical protein
LAAGIGWGVGIFLKLFGEWCLYVSLGVFGGRGMPELLRIGVFNGWDEEEYALYATLVGVGPSPYWSLNYRRVLEYVLFVYFVGFSLYILCIRVTPLCAFFIIFTLLIKKNIVENKSSVEHGSTTASNVWTIQQD